MSKVLKTIKKRVRKSTLVFLILAFSANAFAWFIYTNKVSQSITTGVKSWKITFDQDGNELTEDITFEISSIYPGMNNYSDSFAINNNGEMTAYIEYEIQSVKIYDDIYTLGTYDSSELEDIVGNDYPFKITFNVDKPSVVVGDTAHFSVNLTWPYESGNDALDTQWGKKAYDYNRYYPNIPPININVRIVATQTAPS